MKIQLVSFSQNQKKSAKSTKSTKSTKSVKPTASLHVLGCTHKSKELHSFFKADMNEKFYSQTSTAPLKLLWGLGPVTEEGYYAPEILRKAGALIYKEIHKTAHSATIDLSTFFGNTSTSLDSLLTDKQFSAFCEGFLLAAYQFEIYKSEKTKTTLKDVQLILPELSLKRSASRSSDFEKLYKAALITTESMALAKDFVNEPPSTLNSEVFAERIEKDAKKLKNVKVKILNKGQIKKEKMGLFLSVNQGSAFEPRLVHLTYTPKKVTKQTKHIALVGKGLTYDSGGYSLKTAMSGMKTDMAGAATVYGAFRAAVLQNSPHKISCFMGITDNMVSPTASVPDSVFTTRKGLTVEVSNTDAEGRLVLADVIDYACDSKPDQIIDVATLTGAILVALGSEICGLFSNSDDLSNSLTKAAKQSDEYIWRMPIIPEFRNDLKSTIADLNNMGPSRNGGSCKAAAFLEKFIRKDIQWAHLDIAGISHGQGHLPYGGGPGASGLVIRTLLNHLMA